MSDYYIIENSNSPHEEGIDTLSRVIKSKGHRVILCLNSTSLNRVNSLSFNNYIDDIIKINNIQGIVKLISQSRRSGVVLHNTVSVRNILTTIIFSITARSNIYYIRNANSWIFYSNHNGNFFSKFLRFIATFVKKRLLKKAQLLLVESDQIQKYLNKHVTSIVEVIPYKYYIDPKEGFKRESTINIVIPGAVDLKRKPLGVIFDALSGLNPIQLNKIRIIVLGSPILDLDLDYCILLKEKFKDSVVVFENFIPNNIFESYMTESSYVLGSVQVNHEDIYLKEVYGTTKGSGIFGQAIGYGKPLIINSKFNVPSQMHTSTLHYKNKDDLCNIFVHIIDNIDFNESLRRAAIRNSCLFTIDNISKGVNLI
jgi:hypothetical protein